MTTPTMPTLPPVVQPATGFCRWVFQDPAPGVGEPASYVFEISPNTMTSPFGPRAIRSSSTTAIDGRTLLFEGLAPPVDWSLNGSILTQTHYDALYYWSKRKRRVFLTDHFRRVYLVVVHSFEPIPRRSLEHPWSHTYTMKALIVGGPWVRT